MRIERYKGGRYFAVFDEAGVLVAVTVYRRGAEEVRRRLQVASDTASDTPSDGGGVRTVVSPSLFGRNGSEKKG